MTKSFTAKCQYGKKFHGEVSLRQSVRTAKCPTAKSPVPVKYTVYIWLVAQMKGLDAMIKEL